MLNYAQWLKTQVAPRILLIQASVLVNQVLTTRYLSTHQATVDSVEYLPVIKQQVDINQSIGVDFNSNISFGDIEIANNNGQFDQWLTDVWNGKQCKIYYGEVPAPGTQYSLANNYELIFDGIIEDIDSKSRNVLNLKLRDKLQKLNYPVTESVLGNYFQGQVLADNSTTYNNQSKARLKPLVYGEVHNITPMSTDPTQLEYMVSASPVERIIEVLDNGVPVTFRTVKLAEEVGNIPPGSFRLDQQPQGTVTAQVQGIIKTVNIGGQTYSDTYLNTSANIIATILKFGGPAVSYTDLDSASFASLAQAPTGIYLQEKTNQFSICNEIAASNNCCLVVSRTGKIKLVKLQIPTQSTNIIDSTNVINNTVNISKKLDIKAAVRLGYAKNHTTMTGLVTGIPEEHKNLLSQEYLEYVVKNSSAKTLYSLQDEETLEPTSLITLQQATTVAQERLSLFSTPRKIVSMQCTQELLYLEVGDQVRLDLNMLGIASGTFGLVVSVKPNWLNRKIVIEVLV